jgi:hypothetical protein
MKERNKMILGSLMISGIIAFSLYGIGLGVASGRFEAHDGDEYEHGRSYGLRQSLQQVQGYDTYQSECGSCHLAYPPQLLPTESWGRMMGSLGDHFGENAELDEQTAQQIADFLVRTSRPVDGQYRRMLRNLEAQAPLRITELPYFRHEHDEIPSRLIQGNDKVGSLSQCNACHRGAEKGWFDEDNVVIPGAGRWHD